MTAFSNIELVRLIGDNDSISNNTQGICDGYVDYTSQSASVTAGQTYNLDINLGSCNTSFALVDVAKIFVDWNIDGDFNDYGEEVYLIDLLKVHLLTVSHLLFQLLLMLATQQCG